MYKMTNILDRKFISLVGWIRQYEIKRQIFLSFKRFTMNVYIINITITSLISENIWNSKVYSTSI